MYEPPIQLNLSDLITNIVDKETEHIVECVQHMGVNIDKDELLKALAYDRDQYKKGYADGVADGKKTGCWEIEEYRYDYYHCSECGHGV